MHRHLLAPVLLAVLLLPACSSPPADKPAASQAAEAPSPPIDFHEAEIDIFMERQRAEGQIPGLAVAIVKDGHLAWSKGYGFADIARKTPMTSDTLMNIASVSKTFTNAAVLKLHEEGRLDLDADVNVYLPFAVRNPAFPDVPVTVRQLLVHTSSIDDGSAYGESYACGDPAVGLGEWVEGYLVPGGDYYRDGESWSAWSPGTEFSYSNVGFGLLGYLVEVIAGEPFAEHTQKHLFEPLGMDETSWYLADLEGSQHAIPYLYIYGGKKIEGQILEGAGTTASEDGHVPHCLYSFYNYPDGLVRTSVAQLARFLIAHAQGGEWQGARILAADTVASIWQAELERDRAGRPAIQGLTWYARDFPELGRIWGHSGGDPGVASYMLLRPDDGVGVIVFANASANLGPIAERLFQVAPALP